MRPTKESPPVEAEKSMLGCVLLDPACFSVVREYITSVEMLNVELHQDVFAAMLRCHDKFNTIDPLVLMEDLRDKVDPHGWPTILAELMASTPTSTNVAAYAQVVLEAHLKRELSIEADFLSRQASKKGISLDDLNFRVAQMSQLIARRIEREVVQTTRQLVDESVRRLTDLAANGGVIGLKTGIRKYDELTGGLTPDMHVIAARPSVGKTALALNITHHVAVNERKRVLFVSLEMSKEQLVDRLVMLEGGIDKRKLSSGFLGRHEVTKLAPAAAVVGDAPIEIVKFPSVTPQRLHRAIHSNPDAALVVVDYMQLMNVEGRRGNRQEEVAEISRSLKNMSGEFNVPIIALSQISRDADEGAPRLKHLRESGAIEQDADTVLLLSPEKGTDNVSASLSKGRNCGTGIFQIHFNKATQRMGDVGYQKHNGAEAPESERDYEDDAF